MILDDILAKMLEASRRPASLKEDDRKAAVSEMQSMLHELQAQRRHDRKVAYMKDYHKRRRALATAAGTAMSIMSAVKP